MKDYFGGGTIGVYCPLLYYFGKNAAKGNDPFAAFFVKSSGRGC